VKLTTTLAMSAAKSRPQLETRTRRWVRFSSICAMGILATMQGSLAAGVGDTYTVPHGNFAGWPLGWGQFSSSGTNPFSASSGPGALHPTTAKAAGLASGHYATIWTSIGVGAPGMAIPEDLGSNESGQKVQLGAWLYIDDTAGASATDSIELILNAHDGVSNTPIASVILHPTSQVLPKKRWFFVHTQPIPPHDARVKPNTTSLAMAWKVQAPGTYYFDDLQVGDFEYSEFALSNNSFEDASALSGWDKSIGVTKSQPGASLDPDGYFGTHFVRMSGSQSAWLNQTMMIGAAPGAPLVNQECEAGVWVYVPSGSGIQALEISVHTSPILVPPGSWASENRIADGDLQSSEFDFDTWVYLETVPSGPIPWNHKLVTVEVRKVGSGEVWIDFVQHGERHSLHGNPRRQVSMHMVGWYRSPNSPDSISSPSHPSGIWTNWYSEKSPCGTYCGEPFAHNPDPVSTVGCNSDLTPGLRTNGRRDVAVSVDADINDTPLIGSYDSRDPQVIRYHMDLLAAAGIRSIVFDYNGHMLDLQDQAATGEPRIELAFQRVLDVAEEPGRNFKVAIMYEPKVHFAGWTGLTTFAARKQAIVDDLIYAVGAYYTRRATQKYEQAMMVYVFGQVQCMEAGTPCLDDAAWSDIANSVESITGRSILLVGTDINPNLYATWFPSFGGQMKWNLIHPNLLKYETYGDALNQIASTTPTLTQLSAHAGTVQREADMWARLDDKARIAVGTVWPGFDDSGVAGWGSAPPPCVRVLENFSGAFFDATAAEALARDLDWIQVATWNDWPEFTAVEPTYNPVWVRAVRTGVMPDPLAFDAALSDSFKRLRDVQSFVGSFLGLPPGTLDPQDLYDAAETYVAGSYWQTYD
jgi:hypothetical protein